MASSSSPELCLVTGATGYIGSHVVKQLLERGDVRVRGTVRDLKSEKSEKLRNFKFVPDAKYSLELVEAQLQNADSWIEAVKGCTQVYHVASPLPRQAPRDENELIGPAVDGTLNVLKACVEAGTVKRVVITSSVAAISGGLNAENGRTYTDEDWSVEEDCGAYEKSKVRAERAAWDFVKKLEDGKKFELAVINPVAVFGPFAFPGDSASVSVINDILTGKFPALPHISFPCVDVRDVAKAHLAAMEKPEAAGKRFILYNKSIWIKDLADVMSAKFAPMGYKVSQRGFPKFIMWAIKWFSADVRMMYSLLDKEYTYDTSKLKDILGMDELIDLNTTLIDTCYDLIELGYAPKTANYKSRASSGEVEEAAEAAAASTETESSKPEQTDSKPAEPEQADSKPAEPEQADSKPAEPEQADSKPAETEQADSKPAEPEQADSKPAEPEKTDSKPAEPEQADSKPAEPEQTDSKPDEPAEQAEAKDEDEKGPSEEPAANKDQPE